MKSEQIRAARETAESVRTALKQINGSVTVVYVPGEYDPQRPRLRWAITLVSRFGLLQTTITEGIGRVLEHWPHMDPETCAIGDLGGVHRAWRAVIRTGIPHSIRSIQPDYSHGGLPELPVPVALASLFDCTRCEDATLQEYAENLGLDPERAQTQKDWQEMRDIAAAVWKVLGTQFAPLVELCCTE